MKKIILILILYTCLIEVSISKEIHPCEGVCKLVLDYRADFFNKKKDTEELLNYFVPELSVFFFEEKLKNFRIPHHRIIQAMEAPILIGSLDSIEYIDCFNEGHASLEFSPHLNKPSKCVELAGISEGDNRYTKVRLMFFNIQGYWKIGYIEVDYGSSIFYVLLEFDDWR